MNDLNARVEKIEKKLDIILSEIYYQKNRRESVESLQTDLIKLADSAYDISMRQLDEIAEYVSIEDALYLAKKVARNINNITELFNRLESLIDFWESVEPITREFAIDFQNKLDELEKIGYFEFVKELKIFADMIVENVSIEDLRQIKNFLLSFIRAVKYTDFKKNENISLLSAMKLLNSREFKRLLSISSKLLKNFELIKN